MTSVTAAMSIPGPSESEQIERLKRELEWAHLKIRVLEERLRLQRIAKYGPKSEKLSDGQLQLLEGEPGVSTAEVEAESQREPLAASADVKAESTNKASKALRHPGRQQLPAHLRRVEQVIGCTPEQCVCQQCGKEKLVIGYEQSEQLDVEPAQYFVVVTKREKRACAGCAQGVSTAAVPERIIEKGLVSDRVVINTLVGKYSDHLPLYRQSVMLEREAGISISRATMDGWVMRCGELLMSVTAAIGRELLSGGYIQADETPVPVQMHDGRGKNHQAYLWQYGRPGGSVMFDFRMGRSREGPLRFLSKFEGVLQTDGYPAYERTGGPKLVHAACWAHARRRFFDAAKLNPHDRIAAQMIALIDELFAVDAEARNAGMDHAARHALRQERSRPLLDRLRSEIEAAKISVLPSGALGKAFSYTLSLWGKLVRFLKYPEIELSNNLAENSMRPVVVGRKNWIHVGSAEAGPRVAAILSVVESCRRLGIPLREYLASVLPGLANLSIQRIHSCTPAAWASSRF